MYTGVLRRAEYLAPCTHPFCSCGHSAQVCGRRPHKLLAVITIRCFSRFCSSSQPLISHEAHVALCSFLNTSTLQRSRMFLEIFCVVCVADLIIPITDLALTQIPLVADHRRRGATGATPHQPRRPGGVDHRSHDHDTTDLVISSSRYQRSDDSFLFSYLFLDPNGGVPSIDSSVTYLVLISFVRGSGYPPKHLAKPSKIYRTFSCSYNT